MILRKKYIEKIIKYLKIVPSIFLVGSRQVGKTSILKTLIEENFLEKNKTIYINFDDFVLSGNTSFSSVFNFIDFLEITYNIDFEKIDYFLFDEVKNLKNFNLLLKSLIDKYPNKKFISTSSGNYTWTYEIIEGLAGRSLEIEVFPLDFEEFLYFKGKKYPKGDIDENIYNFLEIYLKEYLTYGGYPKVVLTKSIEEKKLILKSIIDSVFLKDIKGFLKQEKIFDLHKIFSFLGTNIGSTFSVEGVSNYIDEKVYYTKQFINILKQNFLIFEVFPFVKNKRNELKTKTKIYLSDFGIKNFFLSNFNFKEFSGEDIELFVFLNKRFNLTEQENIKFWQNRNKKEIDFIIEKNGKIIPLEVKIGNKNTIPRIFNSFSLEYFNEIEYFIKTTKFLNVIREINGKKVVMKSFLSKF